MKFVHTSDIVFWSSWATLYGDTTTKNLAIARTVSLSKCTVAEGFDWVVGVVKRREYAIHRDTYREEGLPSPSYQSPWPSDFLVG